MNSTLTKPETKTPAPRNGCATYITPLANIVETKDGYALEAEMPGVGKEDLEITVANGELTIVGHRRVVQPKGTALHRETRQVDYRRVFELDSSIDTSRIAAQVEQGVLILQLPKAESLKPRKITVA